jgi:hypothetical protein
MVSVGRIQDHECNIPLIPYDKPMMQIHSELRKIKHMISGFAGRAGVWLMQSP